MTQDQNTGEKTEEATDHKLQEERKKGNVWKSKDIISTSTMIVAAVVVVYQAPSWYGMFMSYADSIFTLPPADFNNAFKLAIQRGARLLATITLSAVLPIIIIAVASEYIQVGKVMATEKLVPRLQNLNPVSGLKRMFGVTQWVELATSLLKTIIIFSIGTYIIATSFKNIGALYFSPPTAIIKEINSQFIMLIATVSFFFILISALDAIQKRKQFMKRMKMSKHDIKQEHKSLEGDPEMKSERTQRGKELTEQKSLDNIDNSNVLIVNPEHIAIAIQYNKSTPIPVILAAARDDLARKMKARAFEKKIPVLKNIPLARQLIHSKQTGIPAECFEIVAEIIIWAQHTQPKLDDKTSSDNHSNSSHSQLKTSYNPPGEDLSSYKQRRQSKNPVVLHPAPRTF